MTQIVLERPTSASRSSAKASFIFTWLKPLGGVMRIPVLVESFEVELGFEKPGLVLGHGLDVPDPIGGFETLRALFEVSMDGPVERAQ